MATLWQFLKAVPDLIKLFQVLQKKIEEGKLNKKVAEDVKKIHEAINANDAQKINDIFNAK